MREPGVAKGRRAGPRAFLQAKTCALKMQLGHCTEARRLLKGGALCFVKMVGNRACGPG